MNWKLGIIFYNTANYAVHDNESTSELLVLSLFSSDSTKISLWLMNKLDHKI